MMPWEHVLIGYIACSLFLHVAFRRAPAGVEAVAVAIAAITPDLIDKPLAWEYGVFPSGYALGHSVFFAGTIAAVSVALAHRLGRGPIGWAAAIGYASHLFGDLLPRYIRDGELLVERFLWPVHVVKGPTHQGLVDGFMGATVEYVADLGQLNGSPYMRFVIGLTAFGLVLWIIDGMPVVRELYRGLSRRVPV